MPTDTNIALGKTATASSSVAPYLPGKVVDGNKSASANRWLANKAPGWVCIDLGQRCAISRWVAWLLPCAGWPSPTYGMAAYELQTSLDNVTWTKVDGVSGNTAASTDRTLAAPVVARFVRLYASVGITGNNQAISIQELEIYGHLASADLLSLVLSSGALVPAFSSSNLAYTQQVAYGVSTLTVVPTAADPTAVIKVNGTVVASGQPSAPIDLALGANTISVLVTGSNGETKTYSVAVTRLDSANLTSLTVKGGGTVLALNPPFSKDAISYAASVPCDVANSTFTVVAENPQATIAINGASVTGGQESSPFGLVEGANSFAIAVAASGGVAKTYTVAVAKAYDLFLDNVVVTPAGRGCSPLTVAMNTTDLAYSLKVPSTASSFTVTPTRKGANAVIKVNGTVVASGAASGSISLATVPQVVQIVTSSPDGSSTRAYTLTISK